ncbi:MAG: hypothetical protein G01um101420_684 [Parcubacteria group bacterium Gr01-1014_20]|nr:MAG: hypothetical protein G01um101420_684 [Parcubacteria group bacterium Gr01-1014_20]
MSTANVLVSGSSGQELLDPTWEVTKDTEDTSLQDGSNLTLEAVPFLKTGEDCIDGEKLEIRAADLGTPHGKKLVKTLFDNRDKIDPSWRAFCLVFLGTVGKDKASNRRVLSLSWNGKDWYVGFRWLDRKWGSRARLIRIAN